MEFLAFYFKIVFRISNFLAIAAICPGIATDSFAENGVTTASIRIGMINAQSGPSASLGLELKEGSMAYIDKINKAGGIYGRKLEIITYDDQYESNIAHEMGIKAIEQDKVFCLFDSVGTPTGVAMMPAVKKAGIPLIGMFTGAEIFRTPVISNVFHIRSSYEAETEVMVSHLLEDKKITEIGSLAQQDAFGDAVRSGVQKALHKRNLKLSGSTLMSRNSENVKNSVVELMKSNPKAIIMAGSYVNCGSATKLLKELGYKGIVLNVSFVGTTGFIKTAGASAEGTYITQVMPSYFDRKIPLVKQYKSDLLAAGGSELGYGSLEGYVNAIVMVEAFKRAGKDLTREALIHSLNSMKHFDVGGLNISYTENDHVGLKKVFLTKIIDGKSVTVNQIE